SDGLADPVGGLRSARSGAAAGALEPPLQRTQALVELTDFGGDRAGIFRSRKHAFTPSRRFAAGSSSSIRAVGPGVHLAVGFVLRHAVALLKPAAELHALALDDVEVVAGELAPLLLNLAFELLPIAFDTIPIHRFAPLFAAFVCFVPVAGMSSRRTQRANKSSDARCGPTPCCSEKDGGVADLCVDYALASRPSTGRGKWAAGYP